MAIFSLKFKNKIADRKLIPEKIWTIFISKSLNES